MNITTVFRYVGIVLLLNSLFLAVSAIISAINSDLAFLPLTYSAIITAMFGVFPLIFVPTSKQITNNEGLVIVVLSWLLSCMVGALPYILWGGEFDFTNAWFESVSGYTTTGSSILMNIEALPDGLIFWRATTHWLGGMGIIMFVLSVLPSMGITGMVLTRSEMSAIVKENFRYNARSTIKIIFGVYAGLTLLETIALIFSGMNLFDALIHSFATIATGGFSSKNRSIAYYNSLTIEIVIMIFMILSGLHFGLIFTGVFNKSRDIFKSTITRYYIITLIVGITITVINLHGNTFNSLTDSVRYGAFQIISVGTSTGFANTDSSIWPALSQLLLIFFALQCACSGSTSGGIKTDRIVMMGKAFVKQLKLLRHPRAVIVVRLDGNTIQDDVLAMGILFICVYLCIVFIATLLLIITGVDMLSAFSGVVATTGNVGPGLGTVGSTGNFSHIPDFGKWVLTATMLLGRLEIYGLIIFFQRQIWKKAKR